MSTKKVLFFNLTKVHIEDPEESSSGRDCKDIFDYIIGIRPIAGRQYDLTESKFCRLERITETNRIQKLLFKSATHKYRAPLLDRNSGNERDNPKRITEGERIKTHIAVRYKRNDVILCFETGMGTLQIQQFINYLNHFARQFHDANGTEMDYRFAYDIMVKDNFLTELRSLNRVMTGELFVDKSVLGSDALNYSERTTTVKHDLKMVISAERGLSIEGVLVDIFNRMNTGRSTIRKIRVKGKNENDNNVIIDSDLIAKTEFVDVDINTETGEIDTNTIFEQLVNIAIAL